MTESWGRKPLQWHGVWDYSGKRFGYFLCAGTECEGSWSSAGKVYLLCQLCSLLERMALRYSFP